MGRILLYLMLAILLIVGLIVGIFILFIKLIPTIVKVITWISRLVLHYLDWLVVTLPLMLLAIAFGPNMVVLKSYPFVLLVLALLSTVGVIWDGHYLLGAPFVLMGYVLDKSQVVTRGSSSVSSRAARGSYGSYRPRRSYGSSYGSYNGCGGEYTGPDEGADPWGSSDDYSKSIGARYVVNKKTKIIFDVDDPAAKTISFKHRKYYDDMPYDLMQDKGYRLRRTD